MRICKICGIEKPLEKFVKIELWRRHTCTDCWNAKHRTGKPNSGRFKKGHLPWIKGKKDIKKRTEPRYKKRNRKKIGRKRYCELYCKWVSSVLKRDKYKCMQCGKTEDLIAHHIIRWEDDENKRFELENGKTLCRNCHSRLHRKEEIKDGIYHLDGITRESLK